MLAAAGANAAGATAAPASSSAPQPAPPAAPRRNPFENIPQRQQPRKLPPQPPRRQHRPRTPRTPDCNSPSVQPPKPVAGEVIEAIEFRGARRVPQDTLRAMIFTKTGDLFSEDVLRRDFMALWNTGRFDDIRLETEPGSTGLWCASC